MLFGESSGSLRERGESVSLLHHISVMISHRHRQRLAAPSPRPLAALPLADGPGALAGGGPRELRPLEPDVIFLSQETQCLNSNLRLDRDLCFYFGPDATKKGRRGQIQWRQIMIK